MRIMTATVAAATLACLALGGLPAAAQSRPEGRSTPLTLEAAVRIALDANPQQRAESEGLRAATAAIGEARAAYYPELDASAGYSRWERHAFLPDALARPGLALSIGPTDDWFAGLSARFALYDGGSRGASLRGAIARRDLADTDRAQARQDLALDVHRAYYGLLAAREALDVAAHDAERAADHLVLARERRAAGAVPAGDVARAQVAVSEGRLHVATAEHQLRVAAGRLNTTMGLSADAPIDIAAPQEPMSPPPDAPVADAMKRALAQRPETAAAQHRITAAEAGVDVAQSAFRPRVVGEGRWGWRDQSWWPTDRDWSAGVAIQWRLFDGAARGSARARARAELAREMALADSQSLRVREDVWRARSALTQGLEAVRASEALIAEAQESVRMARERYRVGAGTITDLLDVQAALTRAGAARVQAVWDYRTATAAWQWALGELSANQALAIVLGQHLTSVGKVQLFE